MSAQILQGDCIKCMAEMEEASVDAVVCDPPYGLSREPNITEVLSHWLAGDDYEHRGGGFMGESWDNFVPGPAVWRECFRVLKPGGHLLAFAGTRTADLMGVSIRMAGFERRDSIASLAGSEGDLLWMFGSGFPKSLDVSKAIDKRPGVVRHAEFAAHLAERRELKGLSRPDLAERIVGSRSGAVRNWELYGQWPEAKWWSLLQELLDLDPSWGPVIAEAKREKIDERDGSRLAVAPGQREDRSSTTLDVTASNTPEAAQWEGWGTALKPSHEPIVVARKPLIGTVAENVLEHGTGGVNVDACRLGSDEQHKAKCASAAGNPSNATGHVYGEFSSPRGNSWTPLGRWPANVVLSEEAAAELDEQTGEIRSAGEYSKGAKGGANDFQGPASINIDGLSAAQYADSGGASRFFYCAKASRAERNAGLDISAPNGKICECPESPGQAPSPQKDTSAPTAEVGSGSSITGNGNSTTDPSPPDSKSTTETKSKPTTESKTSNSSPRPTTSESTPSTTDEQPTVVGSEIARSAESGSPPPVSTSTSAERAGCSTDAADPAISAESSVTSNADVCPDCGGVRRGALRNAHPT